MRNVIGRRKIKKMNNWFLKGLQTGIKTTLYPDKEETAPGISPGLPLGKQNTGDKTQVVSRCPTQALNCIEETILVDYRRCIHCFRCLRGIPNPVDWEKGYEWAVSTKEIDDMSRIFEKAFSHSLHIRFVDCGACGACISEIEQINKPYYNIHRLGFFITPTPREADVLLVAGPVTDHMRLPIKKTYDAMPTPKRVIAIGTCAISGGIFGPSFAGGAGISNLIPADVVVPGCPPPPLSIIHGLLLLVSRKPSASLKSPRATEGGRPYD
jgi:Ni,Fe-hydrogenase III small subunit/ferredoxin-like protein FixX